MLFKGKKEKEKEKKKAGGKERGKKNSKTQENMLISDKSILSASFQLVSCF